MKASEFISMVRFLLKENSVESEVQDSHIIWLADKFKAELIDQLIASGLMSSRLVDELSNTMCINMKPFKMYEYSTQPLSRSTIKIPDCYRDYLRVSSIDRLSSNEFSFVPWRNLMYAGSYSAANRNTVYVSISPDMYVFAKSRNNAATFIQKIILTGIFTDTLQIASAGCCPTSCSGEEESEATLSIPMQYVNNILEKVVNKIAQRNIFEEDNALNKHDDAKQLSQKA